MKKYIRLMVASAFVFNIAFGTTNVVLADKPNTNGNATGQSTVDEPTAANFVHLHITGDTKSITRITLDWSLSDPVDLVKQGGIYSCSDLKQIVKGDIGSITIYSGENDKKGVIYYPEDMNIGTEGDGTLNIWIEYTAPIVDIPDDPEGPGGSIIPPTDPGTGGTTDPGTGGTTDPGTGGTTDPGTGGTTDPGTGGTTDPGTGGTTDPGTGGTTDPGTGGTTDPGTGGNNGNGNGGNGTVTIIDDEDPVPTGEANLPSGNNSNTGNGQQEVASAGNNNSGTNKQVVVIEDEETPLGSLPQTGGIPFEDFVFLGTGLTALGFVIRKKR